MREFVNKLNRDTLGAYQQRPRLMEEHWGIEQTVLAGGYGYRQILELVQNGADAILEAHEAGDPTTNGNTIHVLLRGPKLYVANTGASLTAINLKRGKELVDYLKQNSLK
jgi:alpha-L-arabinofuranosidase